MVLTAGSMSLRLFAEPTARAAAALREVLRARAAARAGVDLGAVAEAERGFSVPGGRTLRYAELAAGELVVLEEGDVTEARLYTFDRERTLRAVGRRAAPHQIEAIVTGAPVFASDVRLPGMLFGRCVRPPDTGAEPEVTRHGGEGDRDATSVATLAEGCERHAAPEGLDGARREVDRGNTRTESHADRVVGGSRQSGRQASDDALEGTSRWSPVW